MMNPDSDQFKENIKIITPESQLRHPKQLLSTMYLDLLASRELAWRLTIRDISSRYRQTIFGILWAFLPILVTTVTFVILSRNNIINTGEINIPYPLYVLIGTIFWQLFLDSLNSPLKIVISNKSLLSKINFPREALILSGILQVLFDFSIRLILLVGALFLFGISIKPGMIFCIFPLISLMFLGVMIGLFLTPFGVLFNDISNGITIISGLWFFLTPIAYSPPTSWPLSLIASVNPVSPLLICARDFITTGTSSNFSSMILLSCAVYCLLIFTWILYRLSIPIIIERISS